MSKKSKPSKPMHRTPLTREQLLPIAPSKARTLSLKSHLALAALRQGQGNEDLASELLKTLYLTFFVNEAEKREESFETFFAAELALKTCIHHAITANEWRLDSSQCEVVEAVLRAYDAQLAALPVHKIEAANLRLGRMLAKQGSFPDLATTQESALGRSGGKTQTT